jgi:hypothetical protein
MARVRIEIHGLCECWSCEAHRDLLDAREQIIDLTAERDAAREGCQQIYNRAKAFEQRIKELEEALRNLLFIFQAAQGKAIGAAERVLRGGEGGE